MSSHGFLQLTWLINCIKNVTFHPVFSHNPSIHDIHDIQANEEATKKGWCDAEVASNKAIREEKTDAVDSLKSDIEELTSVIAKLGKEVGNRGGERRWKRLYILCWNGESSKLNLMLIFNVQYFSKIVHFIFVLTLYIHISTSYQCHNVHLSNLYPTQWPTIHRSTEPREAVTLNEEVTQLTAAMANATEMRQKATGQAMGRWPFLRFETALVSFLESDTHWWYDVISR